MQEAYIQGVSTRRVDNLVRALGMEGISKSQVSRMCQELDEEVEGFRTRELEGPYPYLWLDATFVKVREQGRVVSQAVVIAIGVKASGEREVLGLDVGPSEDGAFWLQFLRGLVARGLKGVKLAISDAHQGLKGAIEAVLQGGELAAVPGSFHPQRPGAGTQDSGVHGGGHHTHRLCSARRSQR